MGAVAIIAVSIPIVAIAGAFVVAAAAIIARSKANELRSAERLAAIERGLTPDQAGALAADIAESNGDGHPLRTLRTALGWTGAGVGWFVGFYFFVDADAAWLGIVTAVIALTQVLLYPNARASYLRAHAKSGAK